MHSNSPRLVAACGGGGDGGGGGGGFWWFLVLVLWWRKVCRVNLFSKIGWCQGLLWKNCVVQMMFALKSDWCKKKFGIYIYITNGDIRLQH